MSDQNQPSDRTVLRPMPGGRPATAQATALQARGPAAAAPSIAGGREAPPADPDILTRYGDNPLIAAAAPLLAFATNARTAVPPGDVAALRERTLAEMKALRDRLQRLDLGPDTPRAAHYAVAATVDDLVLSTPWGGNSIWNAQSMVATFHRDTWGGERFYELLNRAHNQGEKNRDLLELFYVCLSLGFEGKLRLDPRGGAAEHERVRSGLHRLIRQWRGPVDPELSPHWRGEARAHRAVMATVPMWVVAAGLAVLLLGAFAGFSFLLAADSDRTMQTMRGLPPGPGFRLARPEPPPPPPPPAPAAETLQTKVSKFLEPEIREGLVAVLEDGRALTIRIRNTGMFDSGSATVNNRYLPIIKRVADAVETEPGQVTIVGHTDSVPIRTLRFPSNFHLSQARADSVSALVRKSLSEPSRVTAEGHADAEPIATNATAEGREQNRRIDLVLTKVDPSAR